MAQSMVVAMLRKVSLKKIHNQFEPEESYDETDDGVFIFK